MSLYISITPAGKVPRPELWTHREDGEVLGGIRSCAPCPAVWVFQAVPIWCTKQWQFFMVAINLGMSLQHIIATWGYTKAFANGTGFGDPIDPRANYIDGQDLTYDPPQWDKSRTGSRSVMKGTPAYSLMVALKDGMEFIKTLVSSPRSLVGNFRKSLSALVTQNVLIVKMFDGNQDPPLKPGRTYPQTVEDINPDDYLYTPETHPWMFFVANIVNGQGDVVPFPNGAVYPWTGDNRPRTFLPHVVRGGEVQYELSKLRKLRDDEPIPSPYRP